MILKFIHNVKKIEVYSFDTPQILTLLERVQKSPSLKSQM